MSTEPSPSSLWQTPAAVADLVQRSRTSVFPPYRGRLVSILSTNETARAATDSELERACTAAMQALETAEKNIDDEERTALERAARERADEEAKARQGMGAAEKECTRLVKRLGSITHDLRSDLESVTNCANANGLLHPGRRSSDGLNHPPPLSPPGAIGGKELGALEDHRTQNRRTAESLKRQIPRCASPFPGVLPRSASKCWVSWVLLTAIATGALVMSQGSSPATGTAPLEEEYRLAKDIPFIISFLCVLLVPMLVRLVMLRWAVGRVHLFTQRTGSLLHHALNASEAARQDLDRFLQPIRAALADICSRFDKISSDIKARAAKQRRFAAQEKDRSLDLAKKARQSGLDLAKGDLDRNIKNIRRDFTIDVGNVSSESAGLSARLGAGARPWETGEWHAWEPAQKQDFAVRFGTLALDPVELLAKQQPEVRKHLDGVSVTIPALVPFHESKPMLFLVDGEASRKLAIAAMQSVVLRLFTVLPPGQARLVIVDPLARGDNGAPFATLESHDKKLVTRPHTEVQAIEDALVELTTHIETVKWQYLRGEHQSIMDHNRVNPDLAEPFRILLVFDFPVNFTSSTVERLLSVAGGGSRCGILTLMLGDTTRNLPHGVKWDQIERVSSIVDCTSMRDPRWRVEGCEDLILTLDQMPGRQAAESLLESIAKASRSAASLPVPYSKVIATPDLEGPDPWKRNSTAQGITVPIGPRGARDIQSFALGCGGTAHHALLVGGTGSGKTTLLHVIITTLTLKYSPSEIKLYLLDMKSGVGFKRYAHQLPHADVVAIESDREFGWSVLKGLDAELKRRGDAFREARVNGVAAFRETTGQALPRILLIADEFQELFSEDDRIASDAKMFIDRLVRQGRELGIHLLLSTQTLSGGGRLLPAHVMDLMQVRVCMKCADADSRMLLGHEGAAFLPDKGGWGIYKDDTSTQGETFRGAWLEKSDWEPALATAHDKAMTDGLALRNQAVFEGAELAHLDQHRLLHALTPVTVTAPSRVRLDAWLGEPIEVKPATVARFNRMAGSHLLIVSRDEAEGVGMITSALITLLRQASQETLDVRFLDFATADDEREEVSAVLAATFPATVKVQPRGRLGAVLSDIVTIVQHRIEQGQAPFPEIFLVIQCIQRARELRSSEASGMGAASGRIGIGKADESPSAALSTILREGPDVGVHLIASCDSVANAQRAFGRSFADLGMRVGTEMNAEDSRKLLDDTAASRLGKPHRALLVDQERPGTMEKFRPFRIPSADWIRTLSAGWHAPKSQP